MPSSRLELMELINQSTGIVLARMAAVADTMGARMKGLLGRKELAVGEALILPSCNSIHTIGMQFSIDVLFLRQGRVVRAVEKLGPWRLAWAPEADTVVELPAGTLARTATQPGAQLNV